MQMLKQYTHLRSEDLLVKLDNLPDGDVEAQEI
jgi:hypothetical protein